jgi:hypothetical protein
MASAWTPAVLRADDDDRQHSSGGLGECGGWEWPVRDGD